VQTQRLDRLQKLKMLWWSSDDGMDDPSVIAERNVLLGPDAPASLESLEFVKITRQRMMEEFRQFFAVMKEAELRIYGA